MKRTLVLAGLLSASFAGLAIAAEVMPGQAVGQDAEAITEKLQAEGYDVRKIEAEDGYLEAYALLNGKRYEIYVDPKSGEIVEIEAEDD